MAQRPVGIENMAVSSDISTSQHSMKDNGNEENDVRGNQNNPKIDVPKKKTTFKITSVTKSSLRGGSGDLTQDNDLDSQDDLDDTVDSHTEDLSSEIYDTNSKTTDVDIQDPLLTPEEVLIKEKPARFKVVKVETKEPFKRGRWICYDYLDDKTETKQEEIHVNSGSSSAANSVHYVHGVDDPSKNPLIAGATGTMTNQVQPSNVSEGMSTAQGENFQPIQPAPSSQPSVTPVSLTNTSVSNIVAQSSSSVPYYVPQSGQPVAQSMPSSSSSSLRIMNSAPNLPHPQQNQTQTSQSVPSGQPLPHPPQQVPVNPANVHSQPATLVGSVVSQQTPSGAMQVGEYVNSSGTGQGSAPPGQTVSSSQAQQQLPAGYVTAVSSASGMTGNIPIPQQNHPMTATSNAPDGYEENDVYPSQVALASTNSAVRPSDQGETTMSTLELAVGGITNTPAEDDITEEAFLEYFSSLSTYGGSGLFPPIMDESGESAHHHSQQNANEGEARLSSPLTVRCDSPVFLSDQCCSLPSQHSLPLRSCSPPSQLMASSPPGSSHPMAPQLSFRQAAAPSHLNLAQPPSPNLRRRAMLSSLASSASSSVLPHLPSQLTPLSPPVGSHSLSPLSAFPQHLSASWDNLASVPPHELASPNSSGSSHHSSSPPGGFLSPLSAMRPHLSASMEALNLHPVSMASSFPPFFHSSMSALHQHLSSSMEALNHVHPPSPSKGTSPPKLWAPTPLAAFPAHLSASMGALHLPHHQHHQHASSLVSNGSIFSPFQPPHLYESVGSSQPFSVACVSGSVPPGMAAIASTPHTALLTSASVHAAKPSQRPRSPVPCFQFPAVLAQKPSNPVSAPSRPSSRASTPFLDASSSHAYSQHMASPPEHLNQVQSPVDYPKQAPPLLAYSQQVASPGEYSGQVLSPVDYSRQVASSLVCSPASPANVPSPLAYLPQVPSLPDSSPMSFSPHSPQVFSPAYSNEMPSPAWSTQVPSCHAYSCVVPSQKTGTSPHVPSPLTYSTETPSPLHSPKKAHSQIPSPLIYSSQVPSPVAGSPQVPSPLMYSPQMSSPVAESPQVLSPLTYSSPVSSPLSGSPQVFSPLTYSSEVFSPLAGSPRVPSPLTYSSQLPTSVPGSPQVPSPLAYSPQVSTPVSGSPQVPSPMTYSPPPACANQPHSPASPQIVSPLAARSSQEPSSVALSSQLLPSRVPPSSSIPQADEQNTPSPRPVQSPSTQVVIPPSNAPSIQLTASRGPSFAHGMQLPGSHPASRQRLRFPPDSALLEDLHQLTASGDPSFPYRMPKLQPVLRQQPRFPGSALQVVPPLGPPSAAPAPAPQTGPTPTVPPEESPQTSAARETGRKVEGPAELESASLPQTSLTKKPHLDCRRPSLRTQVRNHIGSMDSGSSTVAIDNKIEQAMDLVKSHLMYAVREEVEVLKAQIKELMERMRTVEYENKVLRGDATPETLAKLPAPLPPLQNPYLQQFMTPQPAPSSSSS